MGSVRHLDSLSETEIWLAGIRWLRMILVDWGVCRYAHWISERVGGVSGGAGTVAGGGDFAQARDGGCCCGETRFATGRAGA